MTKKVWTAKDVAYIQVLAQDAVSLNTLIGIDEDGLESELGDFIKDPRPNPEELAIDSERKEALLTLIKMYLRPREQLVIITRFGLESGTPLTLEAVGDKFGVTRERIRQIEERALQKLKEILRRKGIEEGDI